MQDAKAEEISLRWIWNYLDRQKQGWLLKGAKDRGTKSAMHSSHEEQATW